MFALRGLSRILIAVLVCIPSIFLCTQPAVADTTPPPSAFEIVARESDVIVVGTVTDTVSAWNADHTRIFTTLSFSVEERLKGAPRRNPLVITVPGGKGDDGITEIVSDVPSFLPGQRAVVFLHALPSDRYDVYGQRNGVFAVTDGMVGDLSLADFKTNVSRAINKLPPLPAEKWLPVEPEVYMGLLPAASASESRAVASKAGWTYVVNEDFEGTFPLSGWITSGTPTWGKTSYMTNTGASSVWCAGSSLNAATDNYANGMSAWLIYGPFSLSDANDAQLSFFKWLKMAAGDDFRAYMSIDGGHYFYGYVWTGGNGVWTQSMFDLRNWNGIGDATHRSGVYLAFKFNSDGSGVDKGAFVDAVQLITYAGILPVVAGVTPDHASAGTFSQVTITGSGFGAAAGKVDFFYQYGQPYIEGSVVSWTDTNIVTTVPTGIINNYAASASSGYLWVLNADGTSSYPCTPFTVTFSYGGLKWTGDAPTIGFKVNANTPDCDGEDLAVRRAAASWSAVTGKAFAFRYDGSTTATAGGADYANEIVWKDLGNNGVLAHAMAWVDEYGNLVESDIEFNEYYTWSTSGTSPTGQYDIETIALHELGHWLRLLDLYGDQSGYPVDTAKVMYGRCGSGTVKRTLSDDDIAGIRWIYPQLDPDVTFQGWFVGDHTVTEANKGQSVTARMSVSYGLPGQYSMQIWRDIPLWPDEMIAELAFAHDGGQAIKEITFIPPYANGEGSTDGYHVCLKTSSTMIYEMPNTFPPRLRVNAQICNLESISFSGNQDPDGDNYFSAVTVAWKANVNFGSADITASISADAGVLDPEIYLGTVGPYSITGNNAPNIRNFAVPTTSLTRDSYHITIKIYKAANFILEQDSDWIRLEPAPLEAVLDAENLVVMGSAISGYGGLEVSYDLVNNSNYTINGYCPEIRFSADDVWDDNDKPDHWYPGSTWAKPMQPGQRFRISNVLAVPNRFPNGTMAYVLVGSVRDTTPGTEEYGQYEATQINVKDQLLIIPAVPPQPGDIVFKSSYCGTLSWFINTFEDGQLLNQGDASVSDAALRNQLGDWMPGHAGLIMSVTPNQGTSIFESNSTPPYLFGSGGPEFKNYDLQEWFGGDQYKGDGYDSHYLGARYFPGRTLTLPSQDWINNADTAGYGIFAFQQLDVFKGLGWGPYSKGALDYNGLYSYTCVGLTERIYELAGIDIVPERDEQSWPIALSPYKQWLRTVPRLDVTAKAGEKLTFNVYGLYHGSNIPFTELQADLSGLPVAAGGYAHFVSDPGNGLRKVFAWTIPSAASGVYRVTFTGNHNGVDASETVSINVIPARTLSVTVFGNGHVTKFPDQATYVNGATVQVTATADPGWTFAGWSGDANGTDNPVSVTMSAAKTITANFAPQGTTSLGAIRLNPASYAGKTVTIYGAYLGWGLGSPPVTKSDWVVQDISDYIFVTGVSIPTADIGTGISVTGVVRVKNNEPYIEVAKPALRR